MFQEKAEWHIQQYFFVISYMALNEVSKSLSPYFSTYFAIGMYIYPFVNVPTSVVFSGPNVFSNICMASLKSFVKHYVIHLPILQYAALTLNFQLYMLRKTQTFFRESRIVFTNRISHFSANSSLNKNFSGTYLPIFSPQWSVENKFYF